METLSDSFFGFDSREARDEDRLEEFTLEHIKYNNNVVSLAMQDEVFQDHYFTDATGFPEGRVLLHSGRNICLEVFARCPPNQIEAFETYKLCSHKDFEAKIEKFTKTKHKPNDPLSRNRNWDVAIYMVMKMEYFDPSDDIDPQQVILRREAKIYELMWDTFIADGADLEEMTGIPMYFDYHEVKNKAILFTVEPRHKEIDLYGSIVPMEVENGKRCSSLRYLTLEKLGPNVQYLLELCTTRNLHLQLFTFATAFKIFDQLICRLLQLHRLHVQHNDVAPENIYFGRLVSFDVLYLSSYKAATAVKANALTIRRLGPFMSSIRFGSLEVMKYGSRHPIQDIESAFYSLLSMLMPVLPWDSASRIKDLTSRNNNQEQFKTDEDENLAGTAELKKRTIEMKNNLWHSDNMFGKILASVSHYRQFVENDSAPGRVAAATSILNSLFRRLQAALAECHRGPEQTDLYCKNLKVTTSKEYQIYADLRRCVLSFFKFETLSPFLDCPNYRKKLEERDSDSIIGWDLSSWCFSCYYFQPQGS